MATTTNFGWETPDDTDLVKDGAAAMRTLGNAIDTSLVDLKGGTTGQILSKASNTDLDYTWVSPNPGDITGVTAGTGISGGGTSGDVTITNSMATAIDAKGDLIAGTGADAFSRLAVGSNGYTLVADSSTSTGLAYASSAPVNPIINGGMDIWQRGTSGFVPGNNATTFAADRWNIQRGVTGSTVSRQATNDTTNLPDIQYCMRVQRDSGNTSTSTIGLATSLESVNAIPFAGKTVTLSFYARAGANYSAASSALNAELRTGTGTDQNTFSTYTGSATPISSNVTLTTTWQRFSLSATLATTTTEFALKFTFTPVGTAGANDYYEITGVQVDLGSTALPFRRSGGTIQGELAACQRYYYRSTPGTTFGTVGYGLAVSTTVARMATELPVEMRVRPTSVEYGNLRLSDREAVNSAVSALTLATNDTSTKIAATDVTSSSLTQWRFTYLTNNNNTAGYLGFSAEL